MFHPTLNQALEAADAVHLWPLGLNLRYGETGQAVTDGQFVSVYRDERGLYETAIVYASACDNFQRVLPAASEVL
jgi:hypothetical protein